MSKEGLFRGLARNMFGEVTRAANAPRPPPPNEPYTPPPPAEEVRARAAMEQQQQQQQAATARPMEALSEEDAAKIPKSKFSFKKTVEQSNPVFVETGDDYGRLFTLKELPEKQSKGKLYDVLEIRSRLSPHLLRTAADSIKEAGAHPGMFTHDLKTGKVTNIRLASALENIRVCEDLWLMVFVEKSKSDVFKKLLRNMLFDAASAFLAEFSNSQALINMQHVGNIPDCEFPDMEGAHIAIEYEVKGDHSAILFGLGDMLQKKGYHAGVIADDDAGYPRKPSLKVLIPSSREDLLKQFPQTLRTSASAVTASYKDMVSQEIKNVFATAADDHAETLAGA